MAHETRFKALDGLRAIAVMQVVIYHYWFMARGPGKWFEYLERVASSIDGLTLFFVLSGYLIGGILIRNKGKPEQIKVFYIRRFFRIVPLYAVLLISYFVIRVLDDHYRFGLIHTWYCNIPLWSYLVFSQNMWIGQAGGIGPLWLLVTWSLAVEQQFYLLAPWLVRGVGSAALLLVTLAAFVVAATRPFPEGFLLVDRMDALAAGLLLAIVAHGPARAWLQRHRNRLRLLAGFLLAALVMQHLAGPLGERTSNRSLVSLAYALLIHLLADDVPWPGIQPFMARLAPVGLLSYCIYLFHLPILFLTETFLWPSKLLALLLTMGFAAVSYRYFERPLIDYGHRFRYRGQG